MLRRKLIHLLQDSISDLEDCSLRLHNDLPYSVLTFCWARTRILPFNHSNNLRLKGIPSENCQGMKETVATCHTHDLKTPKHLKSTSSKVQGFFTGIKNERPDFNRAISMIGKVIDDTSDHESSFNLEEDLTEKYGTCKQIIGTGGNSTVWVTRSDRSAANKTSYAVKGFRHKSGGDVLEFRTRLRDEHLLLSSIQHMNIIRSFDLVENESGSLFAVLEYCEIGDLHSLIIHRKQISQIEADCFMVQMMRGVNFLHENGIAHRDLKPENMMLTQSGVVKIADFGESERFRVGDVDLAMVGGVCGSSPYIAPEVFISTHYSARAADVWSMGVVYMAMRLGRYMWVTAELTDPLYMRYVNQRKTEEGYLPIEKIGKEECSNVIYSVLDPKCDRRLTASQYLRTEWVKSVELCSAANEST